MQRDKNYLLSLLFFLILVSLGSSHSFAMEPVQSEYEELYQQALLLRNEKKFAEAAKIFKRLAYEGHHRAMHNYAMILLKKERCDKAYHWFSIAAELGLQSSQRNLMEMRKRKNWQPQKIVDSKKIDLLLVVGSNRKGHTLGPVFSVLNGIKAADNSHNLTFDRRATTLDIEKCAQHNAPHISADAAQFDFAKYNIKAAYLERLPTYTHSITKMITNDLASLVTPEHSTTGLIVENLASAMASGAILEIEWHPYLMIFASLTEDHLDKFRTINPFHGYAETLSLIYIPMGALDLVAKAVLNNLSPKQRDSIASAKDLLEFYRQEGVLDSSKEKIRRTILEEYNFFRQALLDLNRNSANLKTVLENSITGALLVDLTVMANSTYIKSYLRSHGFENLSIARTTSERNGRKNVWIIKATKS
jgi:hypothetical protein